MEKSKKHLFTFFFFLCTVTWGQVSVGLNAGHSINNDSKDDDYALNKLWPTSSSNSDRSIIFYKGGTGFSKCVFITWEVSGLFGISVVYRNINFNMPDAKRKAVNNSLGVWVKLNFRSHEKKIVPFVQAEYMFLNSHTLKQEQATDGLGQIQPALNETYKRNLGLGGDLGMEIRLSNGLYAQILGGFHGIEITGKETVGLPTYTGASFQPDRIEGTFFLQFSGGLKYYFSKRKKKRDF